MTTTVSIPGIHCEGCARLIADIGTEFPAVKKTDVDLATKRVTIEHDDAFDLPAWTAEVEAANPDYKVLPAA